VNINLNQLIADREAGTDGPWHCDDGCDVRDWNGDMAGIVVTDTPEIDARLIAAAPELLEALTNLVNSFEKHRPKKYWDDARAAIAKVMGDVQHD
jgi:type VI protein secretion system component VasF